MVYRSARNARRAFFLTDLALVERPTTTVNPLPFPSLRPRENAVFPNDTGLGAKRPFPPRIPFLSAHVRAVGSDDALITRRRVRVARRRANGAVGYGSRDSTLLAAVERHSSEISNGSSQHRL